MTAKPQAGPVTPGSLAALAGLGALASLWALFLWGELRLTRAGGEAFCGLAPGVDCAAVWDSAFATAVHRTTGLPVAAWGLVWGLVALLLPQGALLRAARGQPLGPLVSAVRFASAAGVVAVFVFLAVSLSARALCVGCFVTYVLVAGYAGIALLGWPGAGLPEAGRGLALASAATILLYFALLYPGMKTPRSMSETGRAALAGAPAAAAFAGSGDAGRERLLSEFVASLPAAQKQTLSDSLHVYRQASAQPLGPARTLLGPAAAPVRITEYTDVLCTHCAELHQTIGQLQQYLEPGSFSVEPRQFPLDGECNPLVQRRDAPVRCLAARAQICLEGRPGGSEFARVLFEKQDKLSPETVFALAQTHIPRAELESCIQSPETEAKLRADIDAATRNGIDGTPLVLVNGRKGTSFGPFLYAMVLARGSPSHPAFDALPAPNPNAHVH